MSYPDSDIGIARRRKGGCPTLQMPCKQASKQAQDLRKSKRVIRGVRKPGRGRECFSYSATPPSCWPIAEQGIARGKREALTTAATT